jgi:uncharacterized membrane protein
MMVTPNRLSQGLFLLLSLVGVGIALYLTSVHYEHVPLLCSTGGVVNCERVTSSPYSVVPGTTIPITVPGLGWAGISALLAIGILRLPAYVKQLVVAEFIWSLLALLFVLYLVYVEIVLLHTLCAWCTGLHVVILIMFFIALFQLFSFGVQEQDEDEEETVLTTATKRE